MEYTEIAYEVDGHVATITLDRPDRLNAFTVTMQRELCAAFDEVDADDAVRAVIMTGRGRGFCAGADLGGGGDTFNADAAPEDGSGAVGAQDRGGDDVPWQMRRRDEGGLVTLRMYQCTKPIIGAINGPSVGIGTTMQLGMDIRMASTAAKFGFVFARRGIAPEAASGWFLPRLVGISQALEWCYSGRVFGPEEALAGGLIRSIHEPDDLLPAARELADEIAANTSAVSIALIRQIMWRGLGADHPIRAHEVDSAAIAYLGQSDDAREGVMSFLEKRPPAFTDTVSNDMPPFYPWWTEPTFRGDDR